MKFLELFVPDLYIKSFADLNLSELKERGIRLLVIDVDNTLVPYDVAKPTKEADAFLRKVLDSGIQPVVISNNHEARVKTLLEGYPVPYFYEAKKPLKTSYLKMMKQFGVKNSEVATMGDQLMTDVFGANRCGCYTVLTKPLVKRDIIYSYPNRFLEKIMFMILKKTELFDRGEN